MIFFSNLPQPFYTKILILDLTAMVILHGTVLPIVNYQRAWGTKEKFPIGGLPPLSLRPFILSSQYPSAFFNTSEWALSKRGPSIILTLSLSYFLYSKFFLSGKGKERVHEELWAPDEGRGLLE